MFTSLAILVLGSALLGVPLGMVLGRRAERRDIAESEEEDFEDEEDLGVLMPVQDPYRSLPPNRQVIDVEMIEVEVQKPVLPVGSHYRVRVLDKDTVVLEFRQTVDVWLSVLLLKREIRNSTWFDLPRPDTDRAMWRALFDLAMVSEGYKEGKWIQDQ